MAKHAPFWYLIIIVQAGCASLSGNNVYDSSLRKITSMTYETTFKWQPTYKLGTTTEEAVLIMLKKSSLVPNECKNGVNYLRGGEGEGGWGWAELECAK